jgi:hypothetical protein
MFALQSRQLVVFLPVTTGPGDLIDPGQALTSFANFQTDLRGGQMKSMRRLFGAAALGPAAAGLALPAIATAAVVASLALAAPGASLASSNRAQLDSSVRSSACSFTGSPYTVPASILLRCGYKLFHRLRVEELPGGGTSYIYRIDGYITVFTTPPAGFNPLSASARQLRAYDLPSRAELGAKWRKVMPKLHSVPPAPIIIQAPGSAAFTYVDSGQWAGLLDNGYSNFNDVYDHWFEPHISSSTCTHTAEGTWVGLGGSAGSALGQTGTSYGYNNHPHAPWYEIINRSGGGGTNGAVYPVRWTAAAGDEMSAEANYGNGAYYFNVTDLQSGQVMGENVYSTDYTGNTAESMTEAPSGYNLANFGSFEVFDATAEHGTTNLGMGLQQSIRYILVNGADREMATPSYISNSNGSSYWNMNQNHCD